jgi:hypothetical protein
MPIPARTCPACAYPVSSTSRNCPECGTFLSDRLASAALGSSVLRVRLVGALAFVLSMGAILYLRGVLRNLNDQLPPAPLLPPPSLVRQIYAVETTILVTCVVAGVSLLGAITFHWLYRIRHARSARVPSR